MRTLTYPVFTLKRLLFAASLVLLSEFPLVPVVRPYKDKVTQATCIVVETGVTLIFGLVLYYLQEDLGDCRNNHTLDLKWTYDYTVPRSCGRADCKALLLLQKDISTQQETTVVQHNNPEFTPEGCESQNRNLDN